MQWGDLMKKFNEIEYVRPDSDLAKKETLQKIKEFNKAKTYEDARATNMLENEVLMNAKTMMTIARIKTTIDKSNDYFDHEVKMIANSIKDLAGVGQKAAEAILKSPFKDQFAEEYGDYLLEKMAINKKYQDNTIYQLKSKEQILIEMYNNLLAGPSIKINKQDSNLSGLRKFFHDDSRITRFSATKIYASVYEKIAHELHDIYDEIVKIRKQIAKKAGHKDALSCIYEMNGRFDYTPDEARMFREFVVKNIVPACDIICREQALRLSVDNFKNYDEFAYFKQKPKSKVDTDQLIDIVFDYVASLSPQSKEYIDYLKEYELYDLKTMPHKIEGSCHYILDQYKAPFLIANLKGSIYDVFSLAHEVGHGLSYYMSSRKDESSEAYISTGEIKEIHAKTLELLMFNVLDKISEDKNKLAYSHLCRFLFDIPYYCAIDEFEENIYSKELSFDEKNALWKEMEKKYLPWRIYDQDFFNQGCAYLTNRYIFTKPLYSLNFALADVCSVLLTKKPDAIKDYLRLCETGGRKGYFELLALAKIKNPFFEDTIREFVKYVITRLEELKA